MKYEVFKMDTTSKVNKRFQFSKIIIVIMMIIFIYTLYQVLHFQFDTESYVDTAAYCTCLTVVGGILGTALIQYFKKSATENIPKIQTTLYKDTMDIRLEYNRKMMEYKCKYNMTDNDIYEIENQSHIDEISDNILNNAVSELDNRSVDAHTDIDSIQTY